MSIDDPAELPHVVCGRESITVLHVDDDADLADLAATFLERHSEVLRVLTETSADAALTRIETDDIDCVVSDYEMPEMDGLDLLRAVRDEWPGLPFILFTGKGSEEIASEAISAGVTDYLQKGVGTDRYAILANRIENAVTKHDAERMVSRAYGAMDTAREGIALLDEDGYFHYVNQAYADITGYDRTTLVGSHWELLYPDAHVDRVYDEILPTVPEEGRWSGQTVYERADGERILTNHALAYTDDGTIICLVQDLSNDQREIQALRRDRQRLALLVDTVEEYAAVTLDDSGCVTGWNDGAEALFGYAEGEILGDHVSTFYTETDREDGRPATLLREAREAGEIEDDGTYVRKDGSRVRAHTTLTAVDDHHGFAGIIRDRAASAEESDHPIDDPVLEDALDALGDVFYVLNPDGTVVYVNEPTVTGFSEEEEIKWKKPHELFDPADHEAVEEGIRQTLDTGSDERELRLRTEDGTRRTYEFCSWALTDANGEPYRIVGIGRDVSDRKDRERALNELHRTTRELMRADSVGEIATLTVEALADILTLTHAAVHRYDPREETLVPVAWTSEIEDVIGEPPALGPGSLAWETFQNDDGRRYDDLHAVDGLHNESTSIRSECIVPLGEHGVILVASTEPEAFDENDYRLVQLLCENVTAAIERVAHETMLRQREAELERENERLDEFASLVSHDLRNPLNVASGHLELAHETCDSPHIDSAAQALGRMETLIDDVLALAREGQAVDETEPVALSRVVERCWANVETAGADYRLVDDLTIMADESRLAQVFENLFRNSVEHGSTAPRSNTRGDSVEHGSTDSEGHGPSGSRPPADDSRTQSGDSVEHGPRADTDTDTLTVTVGTLSGPDGEPRGFYVEDDGTGIAPAERERVFEAGYSTGDSGTGFGLRIVKDIVEAHGWDIECSAGETGGARFEITGVEVA
ncbi:PAS domain S-box protein [Haloplanus aerogenes]|uniref:histidine kinase n=1 Tax=Haloplanus aerogenes TaxID=660522 RepID=A0A3M0DPV1_9EURY|nr:PAS domain S-box protein [Haloplanus aerogenes]AZH24696.1 PAS domain S-box protein [Haloplanus aerogenes]RMB23644.1 PAS domain S-box-containing protein [Haloplanus aerogenes]